MIKNLCRFTFIQMIIRDQTAKILKQWCLDQQSTNRYYNVKFIEQSFPQLQDKKGKNFTENGGDEAWYADDGIRLKILSTSET